MSPERISSLQQDRYLALIGERSNCADYTGRATYQRSSLLGRALSRRAQADREGSIRCRRFWKASRPGCLLRPMADGMQSSQSVISTVPHNLHRMRRSALSSLFSKRSVTQYAGSIQSCVDQLCARFAEFQTSQKPVDVQVAFAALTADVISLYSFGRSYNCLGKPNFDRELRDGTRSGGELRHLLKHYPWIFNVMMMLPYSITARLNRNAMDMINRRNVKSPAFNAYCLSRPIHCGVDRKTLTV